jgi:hypothetical protein
MLSIVIGWRYSNSINEAGLPAVMLLPDSCAATKWHAQ